MAGEEETWGFCATHIDGYFCNFCFNIMYDSFLLCEIYELRAMK